MKTILETNRLILREIDIERDIEAWAEMMADTETVRFLGGETMNRAQTWRTMAMMIGHQAVRGFGFYSVIEKSSGDWVGRVGPWFPEGWIAPEVGWTIHPRYTRKGYAKEAGAACVDYVFNTLGWGEVIHVIADGNIGSIKTAEAIGSKYLRSIDGIPAVTDMLCHIYGQSREDRLSDKS